MNMSVPKIDEENFIPRLKKEEPWIEVEYISVDTIDGRHNCFRNVAYRLNSYNLVIKRDDELIFYNLDHVIDFSCKKKLKED